MIKNFEDAMHFKTKLEKYKEQLIEMTQEILSMPTYFLQFDVTLAYLKYMNKMLEMSTNYDDIMAECEVVESIYNYRCKKIPYKISKAQMDSLYFLHPYIAKYSGMVTLTKEWLTLLSKVIKGKCLEVCSGVGSLAKSLQDLGIEVIATDILKDSYLFEMHKSEKRWTHVEQLTYIKAIELYGSYVDYVLVSWAEYGNIHIIYSKIKQVNPKLKIIVIINKDELKLSCGFLQEIMHKINWLPNINTVYPANKVSDDIIFMIE